MGSLSSYVEYFRKIAEEHPNINGFYMMDVNEIISGLRSTIQYPALILEPISGRYSCSNLDNVLEVIDGGFMIIDHLDNPDDFQKEFFLIDTMKEIGHLVLSKMLDDKLKYETVNEKAIPGFNINSISYEVIGPLFNNAFGVCFSFELKKIIDLS